MVLPNFVYLFIFIDLTSTLPKTLEMLHVANGHLDDLGLLHSSSTLLQVLGRYEPTQIGQAVVHTIPPPFLDDPVRHRILLEQETNGNKHNVAHKISTVLATELTNTRYTRLVTISL